ncbi:hypothetical protein DM02DRAFT_678591 [Periconia macrospinosa]|uniref:Uncharacterized protein n=1 Tax=Periconia macrospinosa TaxID=97972 RepID=A0A2V1CXJ9_9PLEO|nr:hypothetical protein DM02DRAFT_678591 [Periconia macrospinosa]
MACILEQLSLTKNLINQLNQLGALKNSGLDLKEQERRWSYIRAGRESDYHGIAIHPKHLSVWERLRGVGKNYDAKLDYESKIREMREDWAERQQNKFDELKGKDAAFDVEDGFHKDVHDYFHRTTSRDRVRGANASEENGVLSGEKVVETDVDGDVNSSSNSRKDSDAISEKK